MSREQFEKRRAAVIAYLYPTYKPYELASEGVRPTDPLQRELAIRERPNRVGILAVSFIVGNLKRSCFYVEVNTAKENYLYRISKCEAAAVGALFKYTDSLV